MTSPPNLTIEPLQPAQPNQIPSTLTPLQASQQPWDIIILGAGLAGTAAAISVARLNSRLNLPTKLHPKILLIDKARFPRDKVCGGCLNQSALAALEHLGITPDLLTTRLGALPTNRMTLATQGKQSSFNLPHALAVSRRSLDAALITHAIGSGVSFLNGHPAHISAPAQIKTPPHITVAGFNLTTKITVLADGLKGTALSDPANDLASHPHSHLGAGALLPAPASPAYPPGTIHMACHPRGYVGLVRVEQNQLNIAAAIDPAFIQSSHAVAPAIAAILTHAGLPVPDLTHARWNAVHALTRSRPQLWQPHILIAGDAAGYVEPFTGEGMAWALWGGIALTPHLIAARSAQSGWSDSHGIAWQRNHAQLIASRQRLCRALAWSLRRPRLVSLAVSALGIFPKLAHPFACRVNTPSIPSGGAP